MAPKDISHSCPRRSETRWLEAGDFGAGRSQCAQARTDFIAVENLGAVPRQTLESNAGIPANKSTGVRLHVTI